MSDAKNRLAQAKRRHRQRHDLKRFVSELAEVVKLSGEVQFHPLEAALAVQSRLYPRLHELRESGELQVEDGLSRECFEATVRDRLSSLHDVRLLVYFCHWEHMGALELTGAELQKSLLGFLEFDGDTVTACDSDLSRIVSFDRQVKSDGAVVYEAGVWSAPQNQRPADGKVQ